MANPGKDSISGDPDTPVVTADVDFAKGQTIQTPETSLHRGLKARHITMIAIGGAVGVGLIIGTGGALGKAGPGSLLIAYVFVGFVVYLVMCALGEMAAWLPQGTGFAGYASRFCDPALGFALGYTYLFKYLIVTPNQLTAAALVLQYWLPATQVNPGVFIAIFLVVIVTINYFGVKYFGEIEFFLSSLKVVVIVGLIILSMVIALGGGPDGDRRGFRYYKNPGAFRSYLVDGPEGKFLGFVSSLVAGVFAYLGTELVGVTVGEAQNPRKTIPRAIKLTFYRILFFYCLSVFFLGLIVPYDSPELTKALTAGTTATASPFVVAINEAKIRTLPGIVNGCILVFVFSAANSDLYIASRTLYSLANQGQAPAVFTRTNNNGIPVASLALCTAFALLAFLNVSSNSRIVFTYFLNLVTIFGLLSWVSILTTHIYWCRARKAQGLTNEQMPYTAPFGAAGSYFALFWCIIISLTKSFQIFVRTDSWTGFDYKTFITSYLGIPVYLVLIFGFKYIKKTKGVRPTEADFYSGKAEIDREEEEFLAIQAAERERAKPMGGVYKYISWLF
ncbi:dicarboxylic amino acid permease [Fusarium solani]|uniref:Dicarboxylic amino acid permease n=2 Tax=Fusarium solani TaxID=169388 RepID=A0A9P9G557_FUSSL|nr:dicarboxylic amino acid permease [Fusarium solani]KAH7231457.1 dicarboxylic amino acid permease [Fusarium solani]